MEQAVRTCRLSVSAGRDLGLPARELSDVYYLALLRFVGCTSDAHEAAIEAGGDEIAFRSAIATVLMGETPEFLRFLFRQYARDQHLLNRVRLIAHELVSGKESGKRTIPEHCEIARMLATRMGVPHGVGALVGTVFERWDGKGLPGDLAGEEVPLPARIVAAARDVEIFARMGGWELAADVLRRRRGKAYDPAVADAFLSEGEQWLSDARAETSWDVVLAAEPAPRVLVEVSRLDDVLAAFADFVDLKSPFTVAHSSQVAELAGAAARGMGMNELEANQLHRAGLVHDLGRVAIPNGIWDKPGPLSPSERERVRLHPHFSERILSYSAALRPLAGLAGSHHERLDASGYHRGTPANGLPAAARLLAAADVYQAMSQPRPHRPPLDPATREAELKREVAQGRLDGRAVECVLTVAGHRVHSTRPHLPGGLTEREVEVLRLIARGHSNAGVARALTISAKTAGHHVENIYGKIGVSSRAAAALFAMENHLLDY